MRSKARMVRVVACIVGLVAAAGIGAADVAPPKPLTLIVAYPAGGPSDAGARALAAEYQKRLRRPVIVENVAGVNGAIGVQRVLDAPADGNTQLIGSPLELIFAPLAIAAVKYKPQDMRLAAVMGSTALLVLVRKDAPAANVEQLIAWAKSTRLAAGNVGVGSLYHLVAVKFEQQAGVAFTHVPYKGGAQLLTDLAGGHLDVAIFPLAGTVRGMLQEGRFKAVAITASTPHPFLPDVPPVSSHPAFADFNFDVWLGVQVPRATPGDVVERIRRDVYASTDEPTFRVTVEGHGPRIPPHRSLEELDRLYAVEIERYQAIAQSIGLAAQ